MSKTLSTGTLSLRFMQNALHRQQLQEVEIERAEVKDEGKWEVGRDVREAWSMDQAVQHNNVVTSESSYLPFLFPSEPEDTGIPKPLGRRTFDKEGRDVSTTQTSQAVDEYESDGDTKTTPLPGKSDTAVTKGHRFKAHANPVSISSLSVGKQLKGFQTFDKPSAEKKGQQSLNAVGFLKPTGVDEPGPASKDKSKHTPHQIDHANKRTRDSGDQSGDLKKKKKKKNDAGKMA